MVGAEVRRDMWREEIRKMEGISNGGGRKVGEEEEWLADGPLAEDIFVLSAGQIVFGRT